MDRTVTQLLPMEVYQLATTCSTLAHETPNGKLKHFATRIFDAASKIAEGLNAKTQDIRIEHAACDEHGVLRMNEKGDLSFTKEGLKNLLEAIRKFHREPIEFVRVHVPAEFSEWIEALDLPQEISSLILNATYADPIS